MKEFTFSSKYENVATIYAIDLITSKGVITQSVLYTNRESAERDKKRTLSDKQTIANLNAFGKIYDCMIKEVTLLNI